jgi:hypothetical protein
VKRLALAVAACGGRPAPVAAPPPIVARVPDAGVADRSEPPCAYLAEALAAYEAREKEYAAEVTASCAEHPESCMSGGDYPGPPTCSDERIEIADLAPPWRAGEMLCQSSESIYSDPQCSLTFLVGDAVVDVDLGDVARLRVPEVTGARLVDLIAGGAPELLVTLHREHEGTDSLVACRADPPGCAAPLVIAGVDDQDNAWSTVVRIDGRRLVLEPSSGTPPAGVLGPHVVAF